jgi:hypothetical protein
MCSTQFQTLKNGSIFVFVHLFSREISGCTASIIINNNNDTMRIVRLGFFIFCFAYILLSFVFILGMHGALRYPMPSIVQTQIRIKNNIQL